MKNTRLLNPAVTRIVIAFFVTLQLTACGLETSDTTALDEASDKTVLEQTPDDTVFEPIPGADNTVTVTDPDPVPDTNTAAVISGTDSASVTEDIDPDNDNLLEASGKLNVTDSDPDEAAFTAKTVIGNFGNLTINTAGNWNYAANNNQSAIQSLVTGASLTETMTVSSVDGTTHNVTIVIRGADEASANYSVSLAWVAPAERADNTSLLLSDIAGYKAYYGPASGLYTNSVTINDGTAEGYTFTNLTTGTYYFVVTTIDTDGRESQYSTEVTKVLL